MNTMIRLWCASCNARGGFAPRPGLPTYVCPECVLGLVASEGGGRLELFHNHDGWFYLDPRAPRPGDATWDLLKLGTHTFDRPHRTTRLRYVGMVHVQGHEVPTILFTRIEPDGG